MAYYIEGISSDIKDRPSFTWVKKPIWDNSYLSSGMPVSLGSGPFRAFMRTNHKYPTDFICLPPVRGVTEAFRAMVEELEPGVHQFFPVEVTRKNGEPLEKQYYLLNVCQAIDAVIIDRSDVEWTYTSLNIPGLTRIPVLQLTRGSPHFTLSGPAIAGRHIWRGKSELSSLMFFSDALMQRVLEQRMRKLRFCRADEIDEPPTPLDQAP
ncbi:putative PAS domain-containing protein [uncultured Gammaproteobacteria bacterium]